MKVMLAGVTAERQYHKSLSSFYEIILEEGDKKFIQHGTRGDVARTLICEKFLESDFDALLMCDLDQGFPKDVLQKLRVHDKDMVSAHYMLRSTKQLRSIWQTSVIPGDWPFIPIIDPPESGLHKIESTGMGCVLIKRAVIEAVAGILPPGSSPFEIGKLPTVSVAQPNFGSDYRFFYLAQALGFELWGDADIDTPHASTLWLSRQTVPMLIAQREAWPRFMYENVFLNSAKAHGMLNANAIQTRLMELMNALEGVEEGSDAHKVATGQIVECQYWLKTLMDNAPGQPAIDYWRQHYSWLPGSNGNKPIEYAGKVPVIELPSFGNVDKAEAAVKNRELAIAGEDAVYAGKLRQENLRKHDVKAAAAISMMNKNRAPAIVTSTEQGEMDEIA